MTRLGMLIIGLVLGAVASQTISVALASETAEKSAFLIVSGNYDENADLTAYREAAGPAAQSAGIQVIARSEKVQPDQVLEGAWPHNGFVVVEKFNSMQELKAFWFSEDYQAAIPLRDGKVTMDFIVAIEGV